MRILVLTPYQIDEAKALLQLACELEKGWEELREELLPSWSEEELRHALRLVKVQNGAAETRR